MNNIEKKLDALIDALGFNVETGEITAGDIIDNSKSSAVYSYKEISQIYPGKHMETECFGGNWIVSEPVADYRLTKRDNKKLIEMMGYAIDIIQGEFSCVDQDILDEFEKAGWINDEKI